MQLAAIAACLGIVTLGAGCGEDPTAELGRLQRQVGALEAGLRGAESAIDDAAAANATSVRAQQVLISEARAWKEDADRQLAALAAALDTSRDQIARLTAQSASARETPPTGANPFAGVPESERGPVAFLFVARCVGRRASLSELDPRVVAAASAYAEWEGLDIATVEDICTARIESRETLTTRGEIVLAARLAFLRAGFVSALKGRELDSLESYRMVWNICNDSGLREFAATLDHDDAETLGKLIAACLANGGRDSGGELVQGYMARAFGALSTIWQRTLFGSDAPLDALRAWGEDPTGEDAPPTKR